MTARPSDALRRLGAELDRLGAALARAEGRRDALRARKAGLERDIGLAKGRLAVKADVESFIEALQADASRRNVRSFETLLTALVGEVLPGEKPVSLELSTERGQLALDIAVVRPDGTREDVLEDNGGALTNVIGMGLRLIAIVKAGAGRFLALDEADCWIAPDRVPAFYRVLEDCAGRVDVQCLAISHHDVSEFDARLRVAHVTGDPARGLGIACPDPAAWDDAQPGFRYVRLVDVQGYRDAVLTLGPGVNALIGPNNSGKSTLVRALRAVFYGEGRDSLVRHGAKAALVEIGLARGRLLRFSRQPRRTPVSIWSLHEADGRVVEENGTRFETGGRAVPDWVASFGISKFEQLDLHIAHQKFPVFLLGEPASRRSTVLSIGQEAGYARDMLAIHRERCSRDANLVRMGERELGEIGMAIERLEDLAGSAEEMRKARTLLADAEEQAARLADLERHFAALDAARRKLDAARAAAKRFEGLDKADGLAAIAARIEHSRRAERVAERLFELGTALGEARARFAALAELPAPPDLRPSDPASRLASRIAALRSDKAAAEAHAAALRRDLDGVSAEMAAIADALGGVCPSCGMPLGAVPADPPAGPAFGLCAHAA